MAFQSINFNELLNCPKGPVSLYEIRIEATGFVGEFAGGNLAGTLLATFSSAVPSGSFNLVNETILDVASFFTGTFPNDIECDVSSIPENLLLKYRITDPCGTSDWYEILFQKASFQSMAFITASPVTPTILSQADVLLILSGYKVDMDGLKLPLVDNVDTIIFSVYSELTSSVVASCEFYVGQDITVDNEGVTYVTGSNNNWFNGGAGLGEFLDPLTLNANTLLTGSQTTVLDKRLWAEANSFIGTDLGSLYEITVSARDGLSGLLGGNTTGFIPKMYGLTIFKIEPVTTDATPPFDDCDNNAHWEILAIDSYRGELTPAQSREFINEATLETNVDAGVWGAATILAGTENAICMEQTGGICTSGLRFAYQVPASFPWYETPPITVYEMFADRNGANDTDNQYVNLLLDTFPYVLSNNLNKICNFSARIRSDSAVRTYPLILLNVFLGPTALVDPTTGFVSFQIEFGYGISSYNQIKQVGYTLQSEGWYINFLESVESDGAAYRREAKQTVLTYHYSF